MLPGWTPGCRAAAPPSRPRARRAALRSVLAAAALLAAMGTAAAVTPGEAADLVVTAYDPGTGQISLTYTPACASADHHIEYGSLDHMGSPAFTGQVCNLGTSGTVAGFDPGPGSYFFVVVGDDGVGVEGSYGTAWIAGAPVERPEDVLDPVCVRVQDLSQRCDAPFVPALDLTVFRPSTEAYGQPFQRTAVPDADELVPGAGIRVNGDDDDASGFPDRDDVNVAGENDLVEVLLATDAPEPPPGYEYVLERTAPAIRVWNEPTKQIEILGALDVAPISLASGPRSVWVENPSGGSAELVFAARTAPGGATVAEDRAGFYAFSSIVIALGGESQVPADPPLEPNNHGTFQLAIVLYRMGYDVHMYDEDVVSASGAGAAYNEVVRAVSGRGVSTVAIFGYSHGGGSTNDLSRRLNDNRASIGVFSIDFTGYIDGIDNDSDIDIGAETQYPPSAAYLLNFYENPGCGFLQLCGGPVSGADNRQVFGVDHFTIDDQLSVLQAMRDELILRVGP